MYDITDIPDWCAYESNCSSLEPGKALNSELEQAMISKSPIVNAHNIKAPYLLVIGGKDLRVPPHFRALVRTLSVNKVTHKVLYYPDSNHALDEVEVEADFSINSALWFQAHGL
uniref:Peptidase S9 prolyl oligopeptidase catalytic domain-containing protein n=1 Tax=Panagrolaimus davidi TaxID=227884 RepID=A0A914PN06_9BILA